jgi:polyisoprenyl-phosphate glycosyltransferase
VSIVLPAYNEAQNVRPIYEALASALRGVGAIEIVYVDDGSRDGTADVVRQLRQEGAPVRLVRFGRNFGHQAALFAGLENARGVAVITMDCDLQHPPELLPRMIEAWRNGAKVVQMIRTETIGANLFKKTSSRWFYRLLNVLSEMPVVTSASDFQLLDGRVVEEVLRFKDRNPFLRGLVAWLGFPSVYLEYVAAARHAGVSGYSFRKMVRLSLQAITGLSSKPLRLSLYFGLLTAAASLGFAVYAFVEKLAGVTVQGWTSVIVVVTFLGAVQLLSIGIAGEYIARIYEQSRAVPRSVIVECDEDIPGCSDSVSANVP